MTNERPERRGRVSKPNNLPPPPTTQPSPAKSIVNVNLNRKLMTHAIVAQLRDTAQSKGMVAGTAIVELLDEYDRIRYVMEGLITAYERDDEAKIRQVLDVLRLIL